MINLAATLQPIRRLVFAPSHPKRAPWMKPFGGVR